MIVMDPPRIDVFRGRRVTTAHLLSTLHGKEGTRELVAFAASIGMDPAWIQRRGEPREHFDLLGKERCGRAQAAGATVDRRLLAETLGAKRRAYAAMSGGEAAS